MSKKKFHEQEIKHIPTAIFLILGLILSYIIDSFIPWSILSMLYVLAFYSNITMFIKWQKEKKKPRKITNFKYEIGLVTPLGIIEKRYFMEWINRNGGDCCGDFYVMDNGGGFSEMIIDDEMFFLDPKNNEYE